MQGKRIMAFGYNGSIRPDNFCYEYVATVFPFHIRPVIFPHDSAALFPLPVSSRTMERYFISPQILPVSASHVRHALV